MPITLSNACLSCVRCLISYNFFFFAFFQLGLSILFFSSLFFLLVAFRTLFLNLSSVILHRDVPEPSKLTLHNFSLIGFIYNFRLKVFFLILYLFLSPLLIVFVFVITFMFVSLLCVIVGLATFSITSVFHRL